MLKKYANKHKDQQGKWPKWYAPSSTEVGDEPEAWPPEQPHPSTQEFEKHWNKSGVETNLESIPEERGPKV